ncbi:hypothetical protein DH2020_021551 [Rehmannia glutinosa]|uniref:S-protein homolog n=1 Tax=Rehmannia glutinosa TaxID=99300 RepID=A0ABR0WD78_REHGL
MAYTKSRATLVFLLMIPNFMHACFLTPKVVVHVANNLPPNSAPLLLHCSSKDDDLGIHTLAINQEFNWSFCENITKSTLFQCTLRAGQSEKSFDAYEAGKREKCNHNQCHWVAKDDASSSPKDLDDDGALHQERAADAGQLAGACPDATV